MQHLPNLGPIGELDVVEWIGARRPSPWPPCAAG
jgi:hypothetical protein